MIPSSRGRKRRSSVLELAQGSAPLSDPLSHKLFVAMHMYMDASGTHDGSHNCVIAGYWGTASAWRRFERAWSAVIAEAGVSEFHAKHFWPRQNEFKGWDDTRHSAFINDLLQVIESSKINPFACGVLNAEWSTFPAQHKHVVTGHQDARKHLALYLALHRVVAQSLSHVKPPMVMHFVFDRENKPGNMATAFDSARRIISSVGDDHLLARLGSFGFAESKRYAPIQAADLLAYEMYRFARKSAEDATYKPRIEYVRALRRFKSRDDFWLFDAGRLGTLETIFSDIDTAHK